MTRVYALAIHVIRVLSCSIDVGLFLTDQYINFLPLLIIIIIIVFVILLLLYTVLVNEIPKNHSEASHGVLKSGCTVYTASGQQ